MTEMRAVIYARVSTHRQARDELPLASQVERCRRRADELGASVIHEFADEGLSGREADRPAFQAAIDFCERHAPDYLICWSTSRFARNRLDAGLYKLRLHRAGVQLVYASMEIDRDSDGGWLTEGMMELMDEYLSRQIAADTLRSMIRNAERGHWNGGNVPFGFRVVPADDDPRRRALAHEPAEAAIVAEAFGLRLDGHGCQTIAARLNERGYSHRGKPWTKTRVIALLRHEAMAGRIVFNRKNQREGTIRPREEWIIVDSHAPIVSPDTWNRVQALLDEAAQPAVHGSPNSTRRFTGILRCGRCGASMQIETAKGRSRRYVYYRCHNARRGQGCISRRIRADHLDDWLVERILHQIITPDLLAELIGELRQSSELHASSTRRRRAAITRQLTELQQAQENLYRVLEKFGVDAPNLGDIAARLRENKAKIATLQADAGDLDTEAPPEIDLAGLDPAEIAGALAEIIRGSSAKKARAFFASFIEGITMYDRHCEILYRPETLLGSQQVRISGGWLPERSLLGTRSLIWALPEELAA